ncbi:hypothetical protein ACQP2F_02605 [Actinoplanes sp. CA-030573]
MIILILVLAVIAAGVVGGVVARRGRQLPTPPPHPDSGPTINHHTGGF